MFSGREPVQFVGIAQKRVLLTPYWFATFCTSAAGSGPSSSSLFLTWLKAVCSLRFHWRSRPVRLRGRIRPGPRVQNGFRRIEVSVFTSFRV